MSTKTKAAQAFKVSQEIDAQKVADTLVSALEGGTGYWAQIDNEKGPSYGAATCDKIVAGKAFLIINETEFPEDPEAQGHRLDRAALVRGVEIMARDYPTHFGDMIGEDGGDATTGDVLMQCALLGEVIYG